MLRCTKKDCSATSKVTGRELGWLWDYRTGWRCPDHRGLTSDEQQQGSRMRHPSAHEKKKESTD